MNRAEKRRQQKVAKKKSKLIAPKALGPTIRELLGLGLQKQTAGNLSEAKQLYQQVLKTNPNQVDALHLLGVISRLEGKADVAIDLISKCLVLKPDFAEAHYNLGNAFKDQESFEQAESCFRKAVTLKPDYAAAHNNLASINKELGNLNEAIVSYHNTLGLRPDNADAHANLGHIFKELKKFEDAETYFRNAISLEPNNIESLRNLAVTLVDLKKLDEAVTCYDQILDLDPEHAETQNNLGSTYKELGKYEDAAICYHKAITLDPNFVEAHFNLGVNNLIQGKLKQGWIGYEWRHKLSGDRARIFPIELWQGEPLDGKNILIYGEQGIGDEIMFAGCITDLIGLSPNKIFLDCDPRLGTLFARSFPDVHTCGRQRDLDLSWVGEDTHIDYCLPIGSLPYFFRNSIDDFPKRDQFLIADQELINKWEKRLSALGDGLKVGISWRGGLKSNAGKKSIPLHKWKDILSLNACFINLQYGDTSEEIEQMRSDHSIEIYDWDDNDPMKDLDSQAALISALDLVITINNTTSGSSGALGIPTWNMLNNVICPMMMINLEYTSPYFSSFRLFRQQTYGDWDQVLSNIETSLHELIIEDV